MFAQFYPKVTPKYQRSADDSLWGVDAQQKVPWTGATVTGSALMRSTAPGAIGPDLSPFPRTSDFRFVMTQPLLRGFGPNASFYELRASRRSREGQERQFELGRQRLAVEVTRAYYQVIQQRQLMAVARQSLERSESLRRASVARLEVGLVSKLDVYRAELQASQAQESMVRAETSLDAELERFRTLLGLSPGDPLQPEPVTVPEDLTDDEVEPLEVLTQRALENRLDLLEARDQVDDARRTASLARQNLLPQLDLNVGVSAVRDGHQLQQRHQHRRSARERLPQHVLRPGALERGGHQGRGPARRHVPRAHLPAAAARRGGGGALRGARAAAHPQERRAAEEGRGGRRAAAAAGHPALPARAGLQLRRRGRGGQPGAGAQRARRPAHELPGGEGRPHARDGDARVDQEATP